MIYSIIKANNRLYIVIHIFPKDTTGCIPHGISDHFRTTGCIYPKPDLRCVQPVVRIKKAAEIPYNRLYGDRNSILCPVIND